VKKVLVTIFVLFIAGNVSLGGDISHKTILLLSDRIEAVNKTIDDKLSKIDNSNKVLRSEVEVLKKEIAALKAEVVSLGGKPLPKSTYSSTPITQAIQPRAFADPNANTNTNKVVYPQFQPLQLYTTPKGLSKKEQDAIHLILNYAKYQELSDSQLKVIKDILGSYK
jgi:hypothetical protein